tara:strand:+ start:107 stop:421 length:315 start_codon:yes stop_codon:yes gene_type:complete
MSLLLIEKNKDTFKLLKQNGATLTTKTGRFSKAPFSKKAKIEFKTSKKASKSLKASKANSLYRGAILDKTFRPNQLDDALAIMMALVASAKKKTPQRRRRRIGG